MIKLFTLLSLLFPFLTNAQVICGTANEGGSITLTAPVGNTFTSIEFASYGTPNGMCGAFTIGGCHAANSQSISEAIFVGQNSATIGADNGVFGDPCGGTPKRLYIQARYSSTLPLKLISFTAQKTDPGKIRLNWSSENEVNTSNFIIERSIDGSSFENVGSVQARGSGSSVYSFINTIVNNSSVVYYRLKMADMDSKYQYSSIVRISNDMATLKLMLFPNPATDFITLMSSKAQDAFIINNTGQVIKLIRLISGSQVINIAALSPGVYLLKGEEEVLKFVRK
jgi:hypothetical protein